MNVNLAQKIGIEQGDLQHGLKPTVNLPPWRHDSKVMPCYKATMH
jgi:hypothetical protein